MDEEVSTNFKSLNGIEISWLVQVLLNFDWFWGSCPLGVGEWVDVGGGWWEGASHTWAHACTHTYSHTCARVYDIIGNSQGFPQWGQPFAWNYHVYHACVCVHVHVCMQLHVHMCGGHPHPPTPTPRAAGSPKHQNSITLELIKLIQFCLKILYLWTFLNSYRLYLTTPDTPHPPPRAQETKIGRIPITLEQIEIIQFCLKICDPSTLLHTYRLGLMCRWGVSYHKWHFYVFDPKKCSCDPPIKKFPIFALDSIRPYLDWALRGFLTSLPIYDPFKFELKRRPKCKIELKCQFAIELSATKKFEIYP